MSRWSTPLAAQFEAKEWRKQCQPGMTTHLLVQHWLLLTMTRQDHRRSLMQAAAVLRDWIVVLLDVLGDRDRLVDTLGRLRAVIAVVAHVNVRKKRPSWFQLVENLELLEYVY